MRRAVFLFAIMLFIAFSGSNPAKAATVSAKEPDKILHIASGFGSATLGKDGQGDPKIDGRIDGTKYAVIFYGCKDNENCTSIQFVAYWKMEPASVDSMNEWNSKKRFSKALIDSDNDTVLSMDVPLAFDVPVSHLENCFEWWQLALRGFNEHIK